MSKDVYLGVVQRDGSILVPFLDEKFEISNEFEPGQNLLVTVQSVELIGVNLPSLLTLQKMKVESRDQWNKFTEIFESCSLEIQTKMLVALNNVLKGSNES